jgi:putative transposase
MRKPRNVRHGAMYHVIARANRGEFIFEHDETKKLFLTVLKEAKKRYAIRVKNFCIMGNHVHLLIWPGSDESLSKIMQWILSVFAIRFNHRFHLKGHVWYDRFRSLLIASLRQFVAAFEYIMNNPVKAMLVARPEDYRYNGVCHIRDGDVSIIDYRKRVFPGTEDSSKKSILYPC